MEHTFIVKVVADSDQPEAFLVTYARACLMEGLAPVCNNLTIGIVALSDVSPN